MRCVLNSPAFVVRPPPRTTAPYGCGLGSAAPAAPPPPAPPRPPAPCGAGARAAESAGATAAPAAAPPARPPTGGAGAGAGAGAAPCWHDAMTSVMAGMAMRVRIMLAVRWRGLGRLDVTGKTSPAHAGVTE